MRYALQILNADGWKTIATYDVVSHANNVGDSLAERFPERHLRVVAF